MGYMRVGGVKHQRGCACVVFIATEKGGACRVYSVDIFLDTYGWVHIAQLGRPIAQERPEAV